MEKSRVDQVWIDKKIPSKRTIIKYIIDIIFKRMVYVYTKHLQKESHLKHK
jgi:hypothetical protein